MNRLSHCTSRDGSANRYALSGQASVRARGESQVLGIRSCHRAFDSVAHDGSHLAKRSAVSRLAALSLFSGRADACDTLNASNKCWVKYDIGACGSAAGRGLPLCVSIWKPHENFTPGVY